VQLSTPTLLQKFNDWALIHSTKKWKVVPNEDKIHKTRFRLIPINNSPIGPLLDSSFSCEKLNPHLCPCLPVADITFYLLKKNKKYNWHIILLGHNQISYLHYALIKVGIIAGELHSPFLKIVRYDRCTKPCRKTYTIYMIIHRKIKFYNFIIPTTLPTIISHFSQLVNPRNASPSLSLVHQAMRFFYQGYQRR
jgi:hypothetical protein